MPVIEVTDLLGDHWTILLRELIIVDEEGICETWHYIERGPTDAGALKGYDMIPLPVFVEWWVEEKKYE